MIPDLIGREVWEQPGWTVAQHTNAGPHPFDKTRSVVFHYTGSSTVPESFDGVRSLIRATQRDYVNNRDYSIGYNWCVDRIGRIWELRGDDYKCAANGTPTINNDPAILLLVNGASAANTEMVESARLVVAHCEHQANRELGTLGHRDVRSTACPGDGIYVQVRAGTFKPRQTTPEDRPVRYMLKPPTQRTGGPWFLRWDGTWSYLTGRDRDIANNQGLATFDDLPERYDLVHLEVFGHSPT